MNIDRDKMVAELITDEGEKLFPYKCTAGKLTIGVGRNLTDRGISRAESQMLLNNDIDVCVHFLNLHLPWWQTLDEVRRRVMVNMCFNLGIKGLLGFTNTLRAIREGRYDDAAAGMLQSKWAKQVGKRAVRLAHMMETGHL